LLFSNRRLDEISDHIGQLKALTEDLSNSLEGTVLDADFGLSDEARSEYLHLLDAYSKLARSQRIWDIATSTDINRVVTRSAATNAITRTLILFSTEKIAEMDSDFQAMHLSNANGGDLFLYPGILAVRKPRGGFALLDMRDVEIRIGPRNLVEEEGLPGDAEQIGHVCAKANKDGSPDRRFRDNYQMPLMRYGEMTMRSKTGLNEVYMVSDWRALEVFQQALRRYMGALPRAKGAEGEGSAEVPYDAVPDLDIPAIPRTPSLHTMGSTFRFLILCLAAAALLYATQDSWRPSSTGALVIETGAAPATVTAPATTPTPVPATASTPVSSAPAASSPAETAPSDADAAGPPSGNAAAVPSTPRAISSLTREEIIDLQMRLVALGFKPGPVDGNLGRRTLDALNQWRLSNGRATLKFINEPAYRDFLRASK
jgi:hypothetical protein